jgi:hypothetical protein
MHHIPPTRSQRILTLFGGQVAPLSASGIGRRVLYRCSVCQRVWYQDGSQRQLDLAEPELTQLVQELSANLETLPLATCRLCILREAHCVIEMDEYGNTDGNGKGFGFNWEAPEPVGAHLLATVVSLSWLAQQPQFTPDIITTPARLRAVLRWLSETTHFPPMMLFTERESLALAQTNPPGFGMIGTDHWQWKGGMFQLFCPPLRDEALVSLAIALPRTEPLEMSTVIQCWQNVAEIILLSGMIDEEQ